MVRGWGCAKKPRPCLTRVPLAQKNAVFKMAAADTTPIDFLADAAPLVAPPRLLLLQLLKTLLPPTHPPPFIPPLPTPERSSPSNKESTPAFSLFIARRQTRARPLITPRVCRLTNWLPLSLYPWNGGGSRLFYFGTGRTNRKQMRYR